jgi:hypothetical protein
MRSPAAEGAAAAVDEYERLEAAAAALAGVPALTPATPVTRRASARSKAAAARTRRATRGGRRGRPKGSGTRGAEALVLVKENPGITIPEIAEKMGIKHNYLYRVLPGLTADGLVVKEGRGWTRFNQLSSDSRVRRHGDETVGDNEMKRMRQRGARWCEFGGPAWGGDSGGRGQGSERGWEVCRCASSA